MLIIDAQVHAWQQGEASGHHRKTPLTIEVLQQEMARAGVDRVLLVPPLWDPTGNAYALEAAQRYPGKFAVMGLLPPDAVDRATGPARVLAWNRQPAMVGLRFLFNSPERLAPLRAGALEWVWPAAEEARLAVAVLVPDALDIAASIAERHPRLAEVIDQALVVEQAANSIADDPDYQRALREAEGLEWSANVAVELVSGFVKDWLKKLL